MRISESSVLGLDWFGFWVNLQHVYIIAIKNFRNYFPTHDEPTYYERIQHVKQNDCITSLVKDRNITKNLFLDKAHHFWGLKYIVSRLTE